MLRLQILMNGKGVSLLELILSTFLVVILAEVGSQVLFIEQIRDREVELKEHLNEVRAALDSYRQASPSYPLRLIDLASTTSISGGTVFNFFLKRAPYNPMLATYAWEFRAATPTDVWVLSTNPTEVLFPPPQSGIFDIRFPKVEIFDGRPVASASISGSFYSNW